VPASKSLGCLERAAGRNMDVKGNPGEDSERKESCRESSYHLKEYTYPIIKRMLVEI